MFRLIFAVTALASTLAQAKAPDFSAGGVVFALRYGQGSLTTFSSEGVSDGVFEPEAGNTQSTGLSLGYNILGHASLVADVQMTGWNLRDGDTIGGGGFVGGLAYWHPLELIWNRQERPVALDVQLGVGGAYGLIGQNRVIEVLGFRSEFPFAAEGAAFQMALQVDYFVSQSVGIGLYGRGVFADWDRFYTDFSDNQFFTVADGVGSHFWTWGLTLDFRFQ